MNGEDVVDEAQAGRPEGSRRHEEPAYGYAVTVPAVFVAIPNTVDPLARSMRGLEGMSPDEEEKRAGSWPVGFADPEVVEQLAETHAEPVRLLEFDVFTRPDPLADDELSAMVEGVWQVMPDELESLSLPGYEYLGVRQIKLGPLDAFAFEYVWDGPKVGARAGDRALVAWAPTPTAVYQVYYHCPVESWDAWLPELEEILASFELVERRPRDGA